jgi:titin
LLLENDQMYQFQVRAMNGSTAGAWTSTVEATPVGKPGVEITATPREFSQANTDIVVTFIFTVPVTGFDMSDVTNMVNGTKPGSLTAHAGGQVYSGTFTTGSDAKGMELRVSKDSVTVAGGATTGPQAVVAHRVTYVAPRAAEKRWASHVIPGDAKAIVTWSDPDDATITKWQVRSWPYLGGRTAWVDVPGGGAAARYEYRSLTNGRPYRFQIRPVRGNTAGKESGWITVTPTLASSPQVAGFTARGGNGQIELSWTSPGDNTITKWQYRLHWVYGPHTGYTDSSWTDIPGSNAGTTAYTIPNIPGKKGYLVEIRPIHGRVRGRASTRERVFPNPAGAPAKPTGFTAAPGDGQVVLSWTDPSDATITRWWYRAAANRLWRVVPNSGNSTTTYTVPSLTNGANYRFMIVAENSHGRGAPTDWVWVTPHAASTPAAPTGLTATSGPGRVLLSWTDPNDASITVWQYRVSYNAGWGQWIGVPGSDAATASVTVLGIPTGRSRVFQVRARNARGAGGVGSVSGRSASDTVAPTVRFSPSGLRPALPNTDVTVTFNEPVRNFGNTHITNTNAHAVVELRKDGTGTDLAVSGRVSINGGKTVITIDPANPLAAGSYTVKVPANAVEDLHGNAITSDQVGAFTVMQAPGVLPAKPTGFQVDALDGKVVLRWRNPRDASIVAWYYEWEGSDGSRKTWANLAGSGAGTTEWVLDGLTNGVRYVFRIMAVNTAGPGPPSEEVTQMPAAAGHVVPSVPANLAASAGNSEVSLSWTASTGSQPISYEVRYRTTGSAAWTVIPGSSVSGVSHTVGSLSNGTEY